MFHLRRSYFEAKTENEKKKNKENMKNPNPEVTLEPCQTSEMELSRK